MHFICSVTAPRLVGTQSNTPRYTDSLVPERNGADRTLTGLIHVGDYAKNER
jgi:hypothetical protein